MNEQSLVGKVTHDLSNKLMVLEGYVTLMGLDSSHITPVNIQKLSDNIASATQILDDFKSSEEFQTLILKEPQSKE